MPMTDDQKRGLKAGVALVVVAGLLAIALRFNKPGPKEVEFDIVCKRFELPADLNLTLNSGGAQIKEARLWGFDGMVSNVATAKTASNGATSRVSQFTLRGSPTSSIPFLDATPDGAYGKMELDAKRGLVVMSAYQGKERELLIEKAPPGSRLVLQSEKETLKEDRFEIPEVFSSKDAAKGRSMSVVGRPPFLEIDVSAETNSVSSPRAEIVFPVSPDEINLYPSEPSQTAALVRTPIELFGAFDPDIRVEKRKPAGLISDHSVDITLDAQDGRIDSVRMLGSSDKRDAPAIHVRGRARAASVQQDQQELLPTWLGEILDKPYVERGFWLTLLGAVAFLLFKVVDHSIGILLKLFLPEK